MNPAPDYSAAYVSSGPTRRIRRCPGTASRSPSAAATTCSWPRSACSNRSWPARTWTRCSPTSAGSAAGWSGQPAALARAASGVVHMATGAVLNACWDLAARQAAKPLWLLLAEMTPEEIMRPGRLPLPVRRPHPGRGSRAAGAGRGRAGRADRGAAAGRLSGLLHRAGLAGYSAAAGGAVRRGHGEGFTQVKIKVGAVLADDIRRCRIAREVIGRRHRPGHRRQPGLGRAHRYCMGA